MIAARGGDVIEFENKYQVILALKLQVACSHPDVPCNGGWAF
jgi:hypothetical protein